MTEIPKSLIDEAGLLLMSINRGKIDLPQLKNFLARVESLSLSTRTARSKKKADRIARLEAIIK